MDNQINLNAIKNSARKTPGKVHSADSEHTPALSPTEIKAAPLVPEDSNRTGEASYNQGCLQVKSTKNRILAAVLAIFLGGIGIHKFYCGKIAKGILCILFCWTYIPSIIAFIEGIIYLTESDEVQCQACWLVIACLRKLNCKICL